MEGELRRLRRDLRAVVREVERLTGLESRWNGIIELSDALDFAGGQAFRAKKQWSCGISVHRAALDDPGLLFTLVHEAVHSVSVGAMPPAFFRFPGYEEGVVERITRLFGPAIASTLGRAVPLESRDAFDEEVRLLERIREMTGRGIEEFYLGLLRTPLAQREAAVVQWAVTANPHEQPVRVLARIAIATRGLR